MSLEVKQDNSYLSISYGILSYISCKQNYTLSILFVQIFYRERAESLIIEHNLSVEVGS